MLPMLCIGGFYIKVGAVNWRCRMPELFPISRMGKSEPPLEDGRGAEEEGEAKSAHSAEGSAHSAEGSAHSAEGSAHTAEGSVRICPDVSLHTCLHFLYKRRFCPFIVGRFCQ